MNEPELVFCPSCGEYIGELKGLTSCPICDCDFAEEIEEN